MLPYLSLNSAYTDLKEAQISLNLSNACRQCKTSETPSINNDRQVDTGLENTYSPDDRLESENGITAPSHNYFSNRSALDACKQQRFDSVWKSKYVTGERLR